MVLIMKKRVNKDFTSSDVLIMQGTKEVRKLLKMLAVLLCMGLGLTACSAPKPEAEQTEHTKSFFAMNTYMTFTAHGENADTALTDAQTKITELEQLWSVTDKDSDIYAINHSGGQPTEISRETVELLRFALQMAEKTGGALEPTIYPVLSAWGFTTETQQVPEQAEITRLLNAVDYRKVNLNETSVQLGADMMLDLGAVGKGYAGDLAAEVLQEQGITSALLDIGGNIQAVGTKPDGSDWRLGLRDPFSGGTLGVFQVSDSAVVTSGNYERYFTDESGNRYGHIINPATGYPAESGLESVTIIAEEGKLCDALSTAVFVMGKEKAVDYWKQNPGFEMILITENGEVFITEALENSFSLSSGYRDWKVGVISR